MNTTKGKGSQTIADILIDVAKQAPLFVIALIGIDLLEEEL